MRIMQHNFNKAPSRSRPVLVVTRESAVFCSIVGRLFNASDGGGRVRQDEHFRHGPLSFAQLLNCTWVSSDMHQLLA